MLRAYIERYRAVVAFQSEVVIGFVSWVQRYKEVAKRPNPADGFFFDNDGLKLKSQCDFIKSRRDDIKSQCDFNKSQCDFSFSGRLAGQ